MKYGKYGNIHASIPLQFTAEKEALVDLLNKGEITQSYYNTQKRELDYKVGMFIASTNGRYTMGKLPLRLRNKNMTQMRDRHTEQVMEEFRKDIIANKGEDIEEPNKPLIKSKFSEKMKEALA